MRVLRVFWWIVWYGGLAMLIYDLNECGCSLVVQLVPILAVPFGGKFVCAASAGIIELVRRKPVEVFAGLAFAGLFLWRSVIGAALAWVMLPKPSVAAGAAIGCALGGLIATLRKWIKEQDQNRSPPDDHMLAA
jgi:hypothetical protein